jgi:hypothetical protein
MRPDPDHRSFLSFQKIKTAGGRPATGDLLLRRQKKVTEEKATPVSRRSAWLSGH